MRRIILVLAILALFASPAYAAICVQSGSITLTWQANPEPDIDGYAVYVSDVVDGEYGFIGITGATDYAVSLGEGDHYFKLKAVDQCGNKSVFSDPSEVVRIDTTPPGKPAAPVITVVAE